MKPLVRFTFLSLLVLFIAHTGHADDITLTGGQITVVCSPRHQAFYTLQGDGFSARYDANRFPPGFLGCDPLARLPFSTSADASGLVTYLGDVTQTLMGSLSFSEDSVFGTVTGYDTVTLAPLFTVNFVGRGVGTFVPGIHAAFSVTSPVPEPATMILLGTALAGIAAKVRRRRKVNQD